MKIDQIVLQKYAAGWELKMPYSGKDKNGNEKVQFESSYHSRIDHALLYIRDILSKDCESVIELISLWESAADIDQKVLRQSGLTDKPKRIAA